MPILIGDTLPDIKLQLMHDNKVISKSTSELFGGKTTALFAVPGAFTPTCSEQHLPGFLNKIFEFRQLGINLIACIAVNDAYVMHAWAKHAGIENEILMLADGSAEFTRAIDLTLDLTAHGMGLRSARYSMFLQNTSVKLLNVEKNGGLNVSKAEVILEQIKTYA